VARSGRWAIPAHLLVCRHTGMVCSKKWPRGPAESVLQRVMGRLLRGRQKEETKLSCLLPEGTVTPVRSARLPDHGVREMLCAWQVATRVSNRRRGSVYRGCSEERSREKAARLRLRLQAAMVRWVTSRLQAVKRLSTQVVRNTGERTHRRQPRMLHAKLSSTLSNSTNARPNWQRRS
jgi:hypothetical protein